MENWWVKNLGDAMLASEQLQQVTNLLSSTLASTSKPNEIAAFIRHESEGRLHCEVKIYLSPLAFEAAKNINAEPCRKPSRDSLSLLVGSETCWSKLFSEHHL